MATNTASQTTPQPATNPGLQAVKQEVKDLENRLEELERRSDGPPPVPAPGVVSDPDRSPTPAKLQDLLPEIQSLAQRVGGMKQLAELVATLAAPKG